MEMTPFSRELSSTLDLQGVSWEGAREREGRWMKGGRGKEGDRERKDGWVDGEDRRERG